MKKSDQTSDKEHGKRKKKQNKTFKNFAEYWHFVKNLPEYQRKTLINSMSKSEQMALRASYEKGGWEDLFMRNLCDDTLDEIKKITNIDLINIRMKVLSGKSQLMHKDFWIYVNACFSRVPWEHVSYIFDGISVEEHDEEYVKLYKINK